MEEGSKAPDFTLPDTGGTEITLSEVYKDSPVVLLFFPLAFSKVCSEELCTVRDNMKLYHSLDCKVLAISIDSFFTLKQLKKSLNLNFTLLSDFNKKASSRYNVLDENYHGLKGVAKRSTFLIDREGIIQFEEVLQNSADLPDFVSLQDKLMNI